MRTGIVGAALREHQSFHWSAPFGAELIILHGHPLLTLVGTRLEQDDVEPSAEWWMDCRDDEGDLFRIFKSGLVALDVRNVWKAKRWPKDGWMEELRVPAGL